VHTYFSFLGCLCCDGFVHVIMFCVEFYTTRLHDENMLHRRECFVEKFIIWFFYWRWIKNKYSSGETEEYFIKEKKFSLQYLYWVDKCLDFCDYFLPKESISKGPTITWSTHTSRFYCYIGNYLTYGLTQNTSWIILF
jgi:hypothetical protein